MSGTPDICLAAGAKRRPGSARLFGWHGFQEDQGDVWRQCRGALERRAGYDVCDIVANFFVAETESVRKLGWDADLKQGEHAEFFLRFKKSNLKAAYVPDVVVVEHNARFPGYTKWRNRGRFWHVGMRKHGIRTYVGFDGQPRGVKGHDTQVVLGVGSGGCGLKRLAGLLAGQPGARVSCAMRPILPWEPEETFSAVEHLEQVRARHGDAGLVGNVAFFYLNYVEQLVKVCPAIRILCLKDERSNVVSRLARRFGSGPRPRNHFTSDLRQPEIQNQWSQAFPTYGPVSLREGLVRYYDDYYATATRLISAFPGQIRMFASDCLDTESGTRAMLDWAHARRRPHPVCRSIPRRRHEESRDVSVRTVRVPGRNDGIPDNQFVFVGGPHRSGTSLLHRMLRSHPQISGFAKTGVPHDEGQHLQSTYPPAKQFGGPGHFAFSREARMTESHRLATQKHSLQLFREWEPYWDLRCPVLVEKSPPNIIRMRFLQDLFPGAHFLMLLRHPVAVAYATQRGFGRSAPGICHLIEHTLTCYELMREDSAHVEKLMTVKYEDLASDPESTAVRILDWLGLPVNIAHEPIRAPREPQYFAQRWNAELKRRDQDRFVCRKFLQARFASRISALGFDVGF